MSIYRNYKGENYNEKLKVKDIAKFIKKYIKDNYKDVKISVRSDINSIRVEIINIDDFYAKTIDELNEKMKHYVSVEVARSNNYNLDLFDKKAIEFLRNNPRNNKYITEAIENIKIYAESYNYDYSSTETDYHNTKFYFFVEC